MSDLRPPATGTEAYLQAIHEVLCEIRTALVDGLAGPIDQRIDEALDEVADAVHYADGGPVKPTAPVPTKRTRSRPPRG